MTVNHSTLSRNRHNDQMKSSFWGKVLFLILPVNYNIHNYIRWKWLSLGADHLISRGGVCFMS